MMHPPALTDSAQLRALLDRHQVALRGCPERKDVIAYLVKVVATEGEAVASTLHLVHLGGWSFERALAFQLQLERAPRRSTPS